MECDHSTDSVRTATILLIIAMIIVFYYRLLAFKNKICKSCPETSESHNNNYGAIIQ